MFYISILTEVIACAASFIFWKKLKRSLLSVFPIYLVFIVISELIGMYFRVMNMRNANKAYYTYVVIPAEFLFFFWLFYNSFKNSRFKTLPIISTGIYLTSWIIDKAILSTKQFWFYSFSYTVGNLLLLVLTFRFFIVLVTSDAILNFKENMLFWICCGLLLFYLGTFPYYGLLNIIAHNDQELHITYWYLTQVLNCVMYLMFTLSFILGKPKTYKY